MNFAAQGQYTITFKLVDVSGEEPVVIISQAVEIGVGAPSPIKYKSRALVKFDIGVDFGTSEAEALAALKKSIYVYGTKGEEGVATISWTIEGYNGNVAGDYTATGRLTLPAGWTGSPADVTATVTVKPIVYDRTEEEDLDVEVAFGTSIDGALAALAESIGVIGTKGETGVATISWSIDGYDGNVAGDYTATGVLTFTGWLRLGS